MTTKTKSDFWKHYEHPNWQKKRLEILTRDNFKCVCCDDSESQLQIHHEYYVSGRKPWQYPNWSLSARCKDCHKSSHQLAEDEEPGSEWEGALSWFLDGTGLSVDDLSDLALDFGFAVSNGHSSKGLWRAMKDAIRTGNPRP